MNRLSIKSFFVRGFTALFGLFHPVEKKVLFSSFGGAQYSDNPRAISEKLYDLYPEFEIVWAITDASSKAGIIPEYVKVVPSSGWGFFKALATSFCYVTNIPVGISFHKRKGQFFIQTWHGDRPIKKVLYETDPEGRYMSPVMDYKLTDLAICASDIGERAYKTAFRYYGNVLKKGMPRNDVLLQPNDAIRDIICKTYNLSGDTKILLYAPTFRDFSETKQEINVDLKQTIQKLKNKTKENWVCFVRAHYISAGLSINCDGEIFIDVTEYPDMADLLASVDMLITDYSASAGDFVLRKKAVVLTMFDAEEYKASRQFAVDPEKAGFIIAKTQDELNTVIETYTQEDYESSCNQVCKYLNIVETGNSADEVCRIINDKYCRFFN